MLDNPQKEPSIHEKIDALNSQIFLHQREIQMLKYQINELLRKDIESYEK